MARDESISHFLETKHVVLSTVFDVQTEQLINMDFDRLSTGDKHN